MPLPINNAFATEAAELMQQRAWVIWEYVRENKSSLNSEKCCEVITEQLNESRELYANLLRRLDEETKMLRRRNNKLRKQLTEARGKVAELEGRTQAGRKAASGN
jgi:septum formation inhibitor MinC